VTNLALPICRAAAKLNDHGMMEYAKRMMARIDNEILKSNNFRSLSLNGNVVITGLTIYLTNGQFWPYQIGADN
jgi:hypothetical protein